MEEILTPSRNRKHNHLPDLPVIGILTISQLSHLGQLSKKSMPEKGGLLSLPGG